MTEDIKIEWEDPGPTKMGRSANDPRRPAMDAHPGKWLVWGRGASRGVASHLPKLGYEVARRTDENRIVTVYARRPEGWTPPADQGES